MPERDEIIQGRYRILEPLGHGAMGIVFAAVHLETEKHVALKWLNPAISRAPGSAERFKREAKATGRIHHPNVVAVYDCGEHDGQLFLAMEYLAGGTLRERMAEAPDRALPLEEALGLLFPVLRGVAAAHAVHVLHRDLKPENVILAESPDGLPPIPKVLDFGLAKLQQDASFASELSLPGSVLGTYQYMAPEQLQPRCAIDERVDVYALGAILYEMLAGTPPNRASNLVDLALELHDTEAPLLAAAVPGLPDALSAVVARALARDRDARLASVEELAYALEPFTERHHFRGGAARPVASAELPSERSPKSLSTTQRIERRHLDAVVSGTARGTAPTRRVRSVGKRWPLLGVSLALQFLSPAPRDGRSEVVAAESSAPAPVPIELPPVAVPAPPPPSTPLPEPAPPVPEAEPNSDWPRASEAATDAGPPVVRKPVRTKAAAKQARLRRASGRAFTRMSDTDF